jgi:hypothetical protein
MTRALSRRMCLKGLLGGAAVAVAMPTFDAMLDNHGEALADGMPIPRRFGLWTWGNGVRPEKFMPGGTGTAWQSAPPESLVPFATAGVLPYVSIVSNTWVPFPFSWAHATSWFGMMGGGQPVDDNGKPDYSTGKYPRAAGPMVIDVMTQGLNGGRKFARVDLAISRAQGGADYLTGDPKSATFNPQALFNKLFAGVSSSSAPPPSQGALNAKKSVLDAVSADAADLRKRLGANDQRRLDEHLQSIASIEQRVLTAGGGAGCVVPKIPGPRPPDLAGNGEPLAEVNAAMADLIAYALSCDLTRVFNFTFSTVQTSTHFPQIGVAQDNHALGHDEPGGQPMVQKTVVFTMQQMAYLLGALKKTKVGSGNLLDHCCIWGTSEIDDPRGHGFRNIPQIVAGRAGGKLKGGIHHDAGGDPDWAKRFDKPSALHSSLVLTMLRAVGIAAPSFGIASAASTQTMAAIEV